MAEYKFFLTCPFGFESIVKKELLNLNIKNINLFNGIIEIDISKDFEKLKYLKTINRVYYIIYQDKILNYDDIYKIFTNLKFLKYFNDKIYSINLDIIIQNSEFNSKKVVYSIITRSLEELYEIHDFKSEKNRLAIFIIGNKIIIGLDYFGVSLHKRGYRIEGGLSPLKENLASAIVINSLKKDKIFVLDPFCGSGTILTETILYVFNKANPFLKPVIKIKNTEIVDFNNKNHLKNNYKCKYFIGIDIDCKAIENSKKNVEKMLKIYFDSSYSIKKIDENFWLYKITNDSDSYYIILGILDSYELKEKFEKIKLLNDLNNENLVIISNLPYGKRLNKKFVGKNSIAAIQKVCKDFRCEKHFLTSMKYLPSIIGEKPNKKRKLYNGKIEVTLFSYEIN